MVGRDDAAYKTMRVSGNKLKSTLVTSSAKIANRSSPKIESCMGYTPQAHFF